MPRCIGPRSADLQRAKSIGEDGGSRTGRRCRRPAHALWGGPGGCVAAECEGATREPRGSLVRRRGARIGCHEHFSLGTRSRTRKCQSSQNSEFRMSELLALSSRVGFRQKFWDPFLIPRMTERLRAACSEGPRRAAECSAAGLAATISRSLPARQRSRASRFSRACSSSASRACPA